MTSKDKMKPPQQIKNEVEKKIIERLRIFGKYCNGLSSHNIEGLKFDADCKNEFELFIKPILTEYDKSIKEIIGKDKEIMEEVALDLFGKEQVRWKHTKLTKEFNEILERNSNKLINRVDELSKIGDNSEVTK